MEKARLILRFLSVIRRMYAFEARKMSKNLPEKITLDQVFERPTVVSQAQTEEDGGGDVESW